MDIVPDPLLAKITKYLERKPLKRLPDGRTITLTRTTFGKYAINDVNFVFELGGGREVRRSTMRRIEAFMQEHPPTLKRAPKKKAG